MDTRPKILTPENAIATAAALRRASVPVLALSGYFDVLQPSTVSALQQHAEPGSRLFAIVLDPPQPLLSTRARAELAASLRVVDYVVCCSSDPADLVEVLQPVTWIREEISHSQSTGRLIRHVLERHGLPVDGRPSH